MALFAVVVLGAVSTITSAVGLAATTALIQGATGLPDPAKKPGYIQAVQDHLLAPNTFCQPMACTLIPVNGPEQLAPFYGHITLDESIKEGLENLNLEYEAIRAVDPNGKLALFGYSQSAGILTRQLRAIARDPNKPPADQLQLLFVGNTNRPNGGILSRFTPLYIPILNVQFDGFTPTDTGYEVDDIAFRWDGIADFPQYPFVNPLAVVNALLGFRYIHPTYPEENPALGEYTQAEFQAAVADPNNRQQFGGTTFVTLPITQLPLLLPVRYFAQKTNTGAIFNPLLALIQPTLITLIELGYDRTIPYGQPTTVGLFPIFNPFKLAADLVAAAGQGVTDAIKELQGISTTPPGYPDPRNPAGSPSPFASSPFENMGPFGLLDLLSPLVSLLTLTPPSPSVSAASAPASAPVSSGGPSASLTSAAATGTSTPSPSVPVVSAPVSDPAGSDGPTATPTDGAMTGTSTGTASTTSSAGPTGPTSTVSASGGAGTTITPSSGGTTGSSSANDETTGTSPTSTGGTTATAATSTDSTPGPSTTTTGTEENSSTTGGGASGETSSGGPGA